MKLKLLLLYIDLVLLVAYAPSTRIPSSSELWLPEPFLPMCSVREHKIAQSGCGGRKALQFGFLV
jgi:hypothetical protein